MNGVDARAATAFARDVLADAYVAVERMHVFSG